MTPIRINVATMGSLKHPMDLGALKRWPSNVMRISHGATIALLGNAEGEWTYTDQQLRRMVQHQPGADITLGLINAPLEDNYYLRRLNEHTVVLSLYEMSEIVQRENHGVEAFVLRIGYALAVMYAAIHRVDWEGEERWTHDEIRRCLFDMCSTKSDIVFSMHRPILCPACRARVQRHQIEPMLLPTLDKELDQLRKPMYYRMVDLVKAYPIAALMATAASGIVLNLIASVLFEKLKKLWPFFG